MPGNTYGCRILKPRLAVHLNGEPIHELNLYRLRLPQPQRLGQTYHELPDMKGRVKAKDLDEPVVKRLFGDGLPAVGTLVP